MTIEFDALSNEAFIRLESILTLIPVSKSHWWRMVKDGKYPQPIKLTSRTVAWQVGDIRELMQNIRSN